MATLIEISIPNDSQVQPGDQLYASTVAVMSPRLIINDDLIDLGTITGISGTGITVDKDIIPPSGDTNPENYFILFAKPIQIEESSLKGYYADVVFRNNSSLKTELFSIGAETSASSK